MTKHSLAALLASSEHLSMTEILARFRSISLDSELRGVVPWMIRLGRVATRRFGADARPLLQAMSSRVLSVARSLRIQTAWNVLLGPMSAVSLSPDSRSLMMSSNTDAELFYGGDETGRMVLWDVLSARPTHVSEALVSGIGPRGEVGCAGALQWSPDGKRIAGTTIGGMYLAAAPTENEFEAGIQLSDSGCGSEVACGWTPDGSALTCLYNDLMTEYRTLDASEIRSTSCDELVSHGERLKERATSVEWFGCTVSPPRVIMQYRNQSVSVVEHPSGRVIADDLKRLPSGKHGDRLAPIGHAARVGQIVCVRNDTVIVLDLASGRTDFELGSTARTGMHAVMDARGEFVALVHAEGVEIWSLARQAKVCDIAGPTGTHSDTTIKLESACWAFARNSSASALVRPGGKVELLNENWEPWMEINANPRTTSVAFGADDEVLVTWGTEVIEFWDLLAARAGKDPMRIGLLDHRGVSGETAEYSGKWTSPFVYTGSDDDMSASGPSLPIDLDTEMNAWRLGNLWQSARVPWRMNYVISNNHFACGAVWLHEQTVTMACRNEHLETFLQGSALVLDEACAWPLEWLIETPHFRHETRWDGAVRAAGCPDEITNWFESLKEDSDDDT